MQEKQDQKVILVSLSIHISLLHEEQTKKKKKISDQLTLITKQYNISLQIYYIYMIFSSHLWV